MQIGFGIYLCWLACQDIREKAVSLWKLLAGAGMLLLWQRGKAVTPADVLPGIVCLVVSALLGQPIGYGDGVVLLLTGICCGGEVCIQLVLLSLLLVAVWSLPELCRGRLQKGRQLPWLPFLAAAYVIRIFF